MSSPPIFIVDAFTGSLSGRALRGNPAAVVVLQEPRSEIWMQNVASEMNLSETAFAVTGNGNQFPLRWFTPTAEVELCGHATLATAHVLWESGILPGDEPALFQTLSGLLTASRRGEFIELDFPGQPVRIAAAPRGLSEALGIEPRTPISYWKAEDDWLLEIPQGIVEKLRPDFSSLFAISQYLKCRGFIVTSAGNGEAGNDEYDFVSRFFGPAVGVDEDPVTGSAHTKLAPFWGNQLKKTVMLGYQASERGGLVQVDWRGDRVLLAGKAQTFLRGELLV